MYRNAVERVKLIFFQHRIRILRTRGRARVQVVFDYGVIETKPKPE